MEKDILNHQVKHGCSEKATKFEKIFHLKFCGVLRISELYPIKLKGGAQLAQPYYWVIQYLRGEWIKADIGENTIDSISVWSA